MGRTRRIAVTAIVLALLPVAACRLHKPRTDLAPPMTVPAAFSSSGEAEGPERWWETFGDPALVELVERALSDNLDIRLAWSRLDQARALAVQAGAGLYPTLGATAGASRTRTEVYVPGGTAVAHTNVFSVGGVAGYEIDLWGGIRSGRDAAAADAAASAEDLQSAAITVAATVADVWYALTDQRAQRRLLDEQIEVGRTFLDLTELRFGQGLGSALDVYQQRTQLASTKSQIPLVELRIGVLEHQLAVLLGEPPGADLPVPADALPELPPLPSTGLPADLLARRPDVRAAQLRVTSADNRVGVAIAGLLPTLRLSATGSYSGSSISDIFDLRFWSIAADVFAPIFEGHRRTAEVDRARAASGELLTAYAQAVLRSFQEVEDALVQEQRQREFLASIKDQVALADATLREARLQYANGLGEYLNVLTALSALQRLQRDRLSAEQQLMAFRIQLYRALAGSWPADLTRPELPDSGEDE